MLNQRVGNRDLSCLKSVECVGEQSGNIRLAMTEINHAHTTTLWYLNILATQSGRVLAKTCGGDVDELGFSIESRFFVS
jgi:hypothetical protein